MKWLSSQLENLTTVKLPKMEHIYMLQEAHKQNSSGWAMQKKKAKVEENYQRYQKCLQWETLTSDAFSKCSLSFQGLASWVNQLSSMQCWVWFGCTWKGRGWQQWLWHYVTMMMVMLMKEKESKCWWWCQWKQRTLNADGDASESKGH